MNFFGFDFFTIQVLDAVLAFVVTLLLGFLVMITWPYVIVPIFKPVAKIFRILDGFLVRKLSPLLGTEWKNPWLRWGHIIGLLTLLAVTMRIVPLPFVFVLAFLHVLSMFSIYRRWVWDEQDREKDLPPENRRMPGNEDLRNEALFTVATIFLISPIIFVRIHSEFDAFSVPSNSLMFPFSFYTLGELLKAIPFVDYSEIYGVRNLSGVKPDSAIAQHGTFVMRILLDFVLIAGLVQLLGIVVRISEGEDLRKIDEILMTGEGDERLEGFIQMESLALEGSPRARLLSRSRLSRISEDETAEDFLRFNAAKSLLTIGNRLGEKGPQFEAIETYRYLIEKWEQEEKPKQRASALMNLGNALLNIGEKEVNTTRIEEAIEIFRDVLGFWMQTDFYMQTVKAATSLGNALREMGERTNQIEYYNDAMLAYEAALDAVSVDEDPYEWALLQNNYGTVMQLLGRRENNLEKFQIALQAYNSALEKSSKDKNSDTWGMIQTNLGNVQMEIGDRLEGEEKVKTLNNSVTAFRKALDVRQRESATMAWAVTQTNLAAVLSSLVLYGPESEKKKHLAEAFTILEESIEIYEKAEADHYVQNANKLLNYLHTLKAD